MNKPDVLNQVYSREELNNALNELLRDESFVNEYLRSELVAILKLVKRDIARGIFKEIRKHPLGDTNESGYCLVDVSRL